MVSTDQQGLIGRGADDIDVQRNNPPPRATLDHGQAAPRQPGIDTHHPHGRLLVGEHLFEGA